MRVIMGNVVFLSGLDLDQSRSQPSMYIIKK
nr:MAG TPA: hypothetical protein [Caudoviricetes sp.]